MNKFIKLLLIFTLALCLTLAFVACDETDNESDGSERQTTVADGENGGGSGNADGGSNEDNDGTTASGNFEVGQDDDGIKWNPLETVPR